MKSNLLPISAAGFKYVASAFLAFVIFSIFDVGFLALLSFVLIVVFGLMFRNPEISDTQKQNLEVINRSGQHLLDLIDQILEMSKIEAGSATLNEQAFDLYRCFIDV